MNTVFRALAHDVARISNTCRMLRQTIAASGAVLEPPIPVNFGAQRWAFAALSGDFKANLSNASPRSLAEDRPTDEPQPGTEANWFSRALLHVGGFYSRESRNLRAAKGLYASAIGQATDLRFKEALGLDSHFVAQHALLSLHIWMLLVRLRAEGPNGKRVAQSLYENFTDDVELRVRQEGIKVRLNKHLTDLEHTFYGSSLAYDLAMEGKEDLTEAVLRNVYANRPDRRKSAETLARYVRRELACLAMTDSEALMAGKMRFSHGLLDGKQH